MRTVFRAACVIGLSVFALACATTDDAMKPAKLESFEQSLKLGKVWVKSVGENHSALQSRFYVAEYDGALFVADFDGNVSRLDASSGKRVWRTRVKTKISGSTGVADGRVFVGSLDGQLICLDAESGEEKWRETLSSEIIVPPQANRRVVIGKTIDGRVFAHNAETGARMWSYDHPIPILTYRNQAVPVVTESQAFIAFDNGQLISFSADDGQMLWSARVSQPKGITELERAVDLDAQPIIDGAFIYSAGANGRVAAINRGTGRIVWGQNASTFNDIALADNILVLTSDESHVVAYDASSGALLWENDKLHRRGIQAPAVLSGSGILADTLDKYIAVIDEDGYMHVLSLKTGEFAARIKPPGDTFGAPIQSIGDDILVRSDNGKLTRYTIKEQIAPQEIAQSENAVEASQ